jgi:PAS domain S-box-containing protein
MIIAVDCERRITEFNEAAQQSFGYTKDEVLGQSVGILYADPSDCENVAQEIASRGFFKGEIKNKRKDRSLFISWLSGSVMKGLNGRIIGYMGVSRDITIQKIDMEMRRNQRIQSLGRLSAEIAHDLNNILSHVLASAGFLKEMVGGSEARHLLEVVEANVGRGSRLVRQIVNYAKGHRPGVDSVDVATVIEELESFLRETFPSNVRVSIEDAATPARIDADSTQVLQVLMNLCLNAKEAMSAGGDLLIRTRSMKANHANPDRPWHVNEDGIAIDVIDSGVGMSAETAENCFDPFFSTKGENGTGLGLTIAYNIIKSLNGSIHVSSQPGKGSHFCVWFPKGLHR